jgi:DNA-binding transcriptional MerR regulator
VGAPLSVEELAAEAGLTVRTVRYYQAEGLLPPPERVGRTARYGAAHVERLELITSLQERGLRLSAISDVLASSAPGAPADWLGLHDAMRRPWSDDRPTILDGGALEAMLDGLPPGTTAELEAAGLVERRDDTRPPVWFVPSPGMLEVGLDSVRLGLGVDEGTRLRKLLQQRLGDLADDLVAQFTDDVGLRRLSDAGPAALAELLHVVQPLARRTVDILFAHEMERAQRELLAKEFRDD